jgi:hypothetical protein
MVLVEIPIDERFTGGANVPNSDPFARGGIEYYVEHNLTVEVLSNHVYLSWCNGSTNVGFSIDTGLPIEEVSHSVAEAFYKAAEGALVSVQAELKKSSTQGGFDLSRRDLESVNSSLSTLVSQADDYLTSKRTIKNNSKIRSPDIDFADIPYLLDYLGKHDGDHIYVTDIRERNVSRERNEQPKNCAVEIRVRPQSSDLFLITSKARIIGSDVPHTKLDRYVRINDTDDLITELDYTVTYLDDLTTNAFDSYCR